MLFRQIDALLCGTAKEFPQDEAQATYFGGRRPEDGRITWTQTSREIFNLIRAVTDPYPGAFTYLSGKKLTVWSAQRIPDFPIYVGRIPGRIVEIRPKVGTIVLTGDGALLLTRVQLDGQEPACAADVLNRMTFTLGS